MLVVPVWCAGERRSCDVVWYAGECRLCCFRVRATCRGVVASFRAQNTNRTLLSVVLLTSEEAVGDTPFDGPLVWPPPTLINRCDAAKRSLHPPPVKSGFLYGGIFVDKRCCTPYAALHKNDALGEGKSRQSISLLLHPFYLRFSLSLIHI